MKETEFGQETLKKIDDFFQSVLDEFKVPGAAIAAIKDNKVVYKKCFGFRNTKKKLPVNENTAFHIASNTKAFTSMSCALLVDDGKLEWDRPIIEYMPHFRMKSHYETSSVTTIDLLTHRTGLPAHNGAFYDMSLTREETARRIQYLDSNKGFRTTLQYNNNMYMIAGHLVECISGMKWEDFVNERILKPLSMDTSFTRQRDAKKYDNLSEAYYNSGEEIKPITFRSISDDYDFPRAPAGCIISSLNDIIKWTIMHLNKGKYNGGTLVSEKRIEEMHRPHMMDRVPLQAPELGYLSTCLGWWSLPYKNHITVSHGGAFGSGISMIPKENMAVIFLPNFQAGINDIIYYQLFDRMFGDDISPFLERKREQVQKQKENAKRQKENKEKENPRAEGTSPSHNLADYEGVYEHPAYMYFEVKASHDRLVHIHREKEFELRHYHYDVFTMIEEDGRPWLNFTFHTDENGRISSVSAPLEPAVGDIVFKKQ